jgi:hypothetical protein
VETGPSLNRAAPVVEPAFLADKPLIDTPLVDAPEPPAISAAQPSEAAAEANLGVSTGEGLEEVAPNVTPPPAFVPFKPLEPEKPPQDDAPLTTAVPEQPPLMQPYVQPQPTEAEQSRYRLPTGTVISLLTGVGAALGWYAWRAWRRAKAESDRVTPYFKKKG